MGFIQFTLKQDCVYVLPYGFVAPLKQADFDNLFWATDDVKGVIIDPARIVAPKIDFSYAYGRDVNNELLNIDVPVWYKGYTKKEQYKYPVEQVNIDFYLTSTSAAEYRWLLQRQHPNSSGVRQKVVMIDGAVGLWYTEYDDKAPTVPINIYLGEANDHAEKNVLYAAYTGYISTMLGETTSYTKQSDAMSLTLQVDDYQMCIDQNQDTQLPSDWWSAK
jgi:hypothetical protein